MKERGEGSKRRNVRDGVEWIEMITDQVVKSKQTKNCAFFVFLLVCLLRQNQGNCPRSETADWRVDGSPSQLKSSESRSDFLDHSSE